MSIALEELDAFKLFLSRALQQHLYTNHYRVITVASTGIAATLLRGGTTAHKRFKLPLNLKADSVSSVSSAILSELL